MKQVVSARELLSYYEDDVDELTNEDEFLWTATDDDACPSLLPVSTTLWADTL
eukprot:CAMPEP_0174250410 /NCGR_PEP_ID=MMETSP0439-20130205/591_1 /TAXON_ID=0 /ORGANISM="Stereomyxa ramosa, Strain Chinc5" /LENGTH=52 /DNA_ID=CAMNT_0015330471 /DNA_START=50 /DNA_END=205 /DNA_ORIENTATION=+